MKLIKPSSPTPNHKRYVKLSLLDQLAAAAHIQLVLFYQAINGEQRERVTLSTSLSKILTHFYPYAGRIIENSSIECTDEGVVYGEAEVDCLVSDVLLKRDATMVKQFLPDVIGLDGLVTIPLLIQASFFKCGGFALGVLANHRIMDGVALSTFIRSWAAISSTNDSVLEIITPDFTMPATLYPPSDLLNTMPERTAVMLPENIFVTKRYEFEGTTIGIMKEKLGNIMSTRVEAISSLMWKCAMKASRSSSSSLSLVWEQLVNIRRRRDPPLPENTPGNHVSSFSVHSRVHDDEETHGFLLLLRYGLREFCDNRMKKLQDAVLSVRCSAILDLDQERGNKLKENDVDLFVLTSWCGFKLYDANFGWGKPEWIGFPNLPFKNTIALMDTKEGDNIEAWVTLTEDYMFEFEQEEDLLLLANSYAS